MSSEKFCLRWNDFESNISVAFRELRDDKDFFDVTLACDDEQIQAHKVILSACSPFFRNILRRNAHQHPLLYLKGVKYTDLQSVLNFMYHGEVNVAQEELNSFLAVAEDLRVKGLTQGPGSAAHSSKPKSDHIRAPRPKSPPVQRPASPQHKRHRATADLEDEIQEVVQVPVKAEPLDHVQPAPQVEQPKYYSPLSSKVSAPIISTTPQPSYSADPGTQLASYSTPSTQVESYSTPSSQVASYTTDIYDEQQDESYEDYGHEYEQDYNGQGMEPAAAAAGKGVDGNKLTLSYIEKDPASGPKSHRCTICGKTGNDRSNLRRHVESVHFPQSFQYDCKYCEKVFNAKNSLYVHISTYHRDQK